MGWQQDGRVEGLLPEKLMYIPFSRAGTQAPAWPPLLLQQTQAQSRGGSPALGHLPGESAIKSNWIFVLK